MEAADFRDAHRRGEYLLCYMALGTLERIDLTQLLRNLCLVIDLWRPSAVCM